ncbi:MAG: hypothetical protein RMM29_05345 [Planctomycetota bacterium]|nr:hypothetical protein [Planctomycetota bacterium]MCX8040587.1 hypothetical protein [Planctomycetota bacterium]MDW8373059.1 hypothetical protein [Planctomycetota bacterium]
MIKINLLPPEYRRKRQTSVDPRVIAAAGGAIIVIASIAIWLWLQFVRLPAAQALLAQRQQELAEATARAEKVRQIDKQIEDFEQLHRTITELIARKVLWARTLDDFANLLTQHGGHRWTRDGFEVRCTNLTIAPANPAGTAVARNAPAAVTYAFRATFRILGDQRDMVGDYIQSFFRTIEASTFWRDHGFAGRPDANYRGQTPRLSPETGKVIIELPLEWRRTKTVTTAPSGSGGRAP